MKRKFKEKLSQLGVAVVYLFGSRSQGIESPSSDVDIGVVMKGPSPGEDTRSIYDRLYPIFSDLYPSAKVDIVFLQKSPLTLQFSAIQEGTVLFEEDPIFTADYEQQVINQYLDFRPLLDYFDFVAAERYAQT